MARSGHPVERVDWLRQRERGAVWAIELASLVATGFGRPAARALARGIAAYYLVFDGRARRASRAWLERVHGRPVALAEIQRHLSCFAQATMDRLFFARGALQGLDIRRTGNQHLEALTREKRGAILLGAHLGSFDAMRASSESERFPVTIVGHFENARMINAVLERLDPAQSSRVVHAGRDPVALALTLRDRLAAGGMVALLADRVGLNDKSIAVDFFGAKARFATGPFLLAAILKCPIYLVFGIYHPPNRYELFCEPFAERIVLPRGQREEVLREEVARYARRLEAFARQTPDNWFNFFDFWEQGQS
jgi:predicted LPLAT superfamily acyltransferase